ncbi:hypothetical protein ACP4OV_007084 [Aristida adscensionis]
MSRQEEMAAPPPGPHHPPDIQVLPGDDTPVPARAASHFPMRVNPISWLNTVFSDIGEDLPVVEMNRCDATRRWSTHITASIREGGLSAVERGEVQHIEVHSAEAGSKHIAECDAVRKVLAQIDERTDHCLLDYNYFKLVVYSEHADVRHMPKRISRLYAQLGDCMFNSFLHTEVSLREVLRQVVQPLGYSFTQPIVLRVEAGRFQAHTTFLSDAWTFTVYGEALETPYDARDSAFVYALEYVDRFMGIDIVDLHRGRYLMVARV